MHTLPDDDRSLSSLSASVTRLGEGGFIVSCQLPSTHTPGEKRVKPPGIKPRGNTSFYEA
jgi:hypothetical protein